jgi:hypothetical protein
MISKPDCLADHQWEAVLKAREIITEHFEGVNLAIFLNWVNENRDTARGEILAGNEFAIKHHIERWLDGDFESLDEDPKSIA